MTTALPSLIVVALTLVVTGWWYERTRPSARVLALVATLAALAAIARVAFAPLPNVKPTTDIVLFAGIVLGGAPGFAVGAITALASNVVFGQGPWTVWQMLAWGSCGLLGAGLGAVVRGPINRWVLAAICAFAGVMFGVIMNVSTWLSFTGGGVDEAIVIATTSAPFDVAHIAGNVVFALVFGPAMLGALRRTRARAEGRFVDELPEVARPTA
ncbi:MAG: ECF transporter S component [Patulibacter sp.]|nr:ECF transporter S component [Patulibacter sp.]